MADQERNPLVFNSNSAGKQARDRALFDLNRRLGDKDKILTADDMSGLYDVKRGLFTTHNGDYRPITSDDLVIFRQAVKDIQKRHGLQKDGKGVSGGILPKQVIDLSRPEDRKRANREIHQCVPVSNRGSVVHFQTNAGPNSDVERHHVHVQFLGYDSALSSGLAVPDAAKQMAKGKVKFDCDCGRHTFWYRYIATIGNFNYGRAEDGFPKHRNPMLYGIACKHVLRVMATIGHGPAFSAYARRMLEHGRKTLSPSARQIVSVKEQEEFLQKTSGLRKRDRTVATTGEKREARAGTPAAMQKAAARLKAANESLRKTHATKVNKPVSSEKKIKTLMGLGYSRDAAMAAIAAADKAQGA